MERVKGNDSVREGLRRKIKRIREDKEDCRFNRMLLLLDEARNCIPENEEPRVVDLSITFAQEDEEECPQETLPTIPPEDIPPTATDDSMATDDSNDELQKSIPAEVSLDSQPVTQVHFPRCTSRIRIPSTILSRDKPELGFIPGIVEELSGPSQSEAVEQLLGIYKSKSRSRRIARGPIHVREENNDEVNIILKDLPNFNNKNLDPAALKSILVDDVFGYVGEKQNWLEEKLTMHFQSSESISPKGFVEPNVSGSLNGGEAHSEDSNSENDCSSDDESTSFESALDCPDYQDVVASPATLYCPRCKQYECNLHFQPYGKTEIPSARLRYTAGMEAEACRKGSTLQNVTPLFNPKRPLGLTSLQKSVCQRLFLIYEGNSQKVAIFLNAQKKSVEDFCLGIVLPLKVKAKPNFGTTSWFSVKNYPKQVLALNTGLDTFKPCIHPSNPCKKGMCCCVDQNIFCLKTCARGVGSRNFFRGCDCKGPCGKNCTCRVYRRECDPDLCLCGACLDPAGEPLSKQNCENDNITMSRGIQTCVAISGIKNAGFGLFSRFPISNGQFINEYVGELVTHDEGERRGQLYDLMNDTSHFELPSDMCLDASNMCNEMRFINNSMDTPIEPNVKQMCWLVEGTSRIAMYAGQDIPAQAELFFDYGFSVHSNHHKSPSKKGC
eukprot:scaffold3028_cov174-Amphora_coffeaeformis.AAC.18